MLDSLNTYHRRVRDGIAAIRRFCENDTANLPDFARARSTLVQISRERTRFINDVIIPRLLWNSNQTTPRQILSLQQLLAERRAISTDHVNHWPIDAIAADRTGYCQSATRILLIMEKQINEEHELLTRYLKQINL